MRAFLREVSEVIRFNYVVSGGNTSTNIESPCRSNTFYLYVNSNPSILESVPPGVKGFHLIRDPRDALVSDYFSRRNSHSVDTQEKQTLREYLLHHPQEEGLMHMLDKCTYLQQIDGWPLGQQSNILDVRYEDMLEDAETQFVGILRHLSVTMPASVLRAVVEACSFRQRSGGRAPGQEDPNAHLRKGVAGDWKNYMPPGSRVHSEFLARYGHVLDLLGYAIECNRDDATRRTV